MNHRFAAALAIVIAASPALAAGEAEALAAHFRNMHITNQVEHLTRQGFAEAVQRTSDEQCYLSFTHVIMLYGFLNAGNSVNYALARELEVTGSNAIASYVASRHGFRATGTTTQETIAVAEEVRAICFDQRDRLMEAASRG